MTVKNEDKIKLSYSYSVKGGEKEYESGNTSEPIEFQVGKGEVIKGIEDAVIGMKQGEKKKITVSPEKAFGERKDDLVQKAPKELFQDRRVKEGDFIELRMANGQFASAQVVSIEEESVTFDLNHPLAGKTLNFEIEVIDIK